MFDSLTTSVKWHCKEKPVDSGATGYSMLFEICSWKRCFGLNGLVIEVVISESKAAL